MAMKRAARYTLIGVAGLVALLVLAVLILTRTDAGVERAGRLALNQVRGSINGDLSVGSIRSGGLLRGAVLDDVRLVGADGRPFVEADSARLAYRLGGLIGGDIAFDRLVLFAPRVVIERLPGDEEWNYQRIFASDTTPQPSSRDNLVLLEDIEIHDGLVLVRMPWEPEEPVEPDDTARLVLEEVPGGVVRTMRFDALEARLPRIVWEAPGQDRKLIEVGRLSTEAYIWETAARIEAVEGTVVLRDSLITLDAPRLRLPDSEVGLAGQIITGEENQYDIEVDGRDVAFADFQWLYPPLPDDGGGRLQLRMQTRGPGSMLWLARDALLRTGDTEVAGSFGIVTGDTLYFTNVDLEASPLDLELLQQLVPSSLPLEGLLIGTVEIEGPVSALETRGDATFTALGRQSRLRWSGTIGLTPPYTARELEIEGRAVDLERVARFAPGLRVRGLGTGRVRATGSVERGLALQATASIGADGDASAATGSGIVAVAADGSAVDLRVEADGIAGELLAEQFPALEGLAGRLTGPVVVRGSLDTLQVDARLRGPRGTLQVLGRVAPKGPRPWYRLDGTADGLGIDGLVPSAPHTVVTGTFGLEGTGLDPATLELRATIDLMDGEFAGLGLRRSVAAGRVSDGTLHLDSLVLTTRAGRVRAAGDFGVVRGRTGDLAVAVEADNLEALEPLLSADDLEGAGTDTAPARLAGGVTARGLVRGSPYDWTVEGRGTVAGLAYGQVVVEAGSGEVEWRRGYGVVEASARHVRLGDRRIERAEATVSWAGDAGGFSGAAVGPEAAQFSAVGAFRSAPGSGRVIDLARAELSTRDGRWTTTAPAVIRAAGGGVAVDSLVLRRAPGGGSIRVAGALPWAAEVGPGTDEAGERGVDDRPADMHVELAHVQLGELLRVTQTDTTVGGEVTGRIRVTGTARSPRVEGAVHAAPFRLAGAVFDSATGEIEYARERLDAAFEGWGGGRAVVRGGGRVPIDLALAPRSERLLDRPMHLTARADSLPAALVSFLMPGFQNVSGVVNGALTLAGTSRTPELGGQLVLSDGSAYFRPLGIEYESLGLTARMGAGSVVAVDARLGTGTGVARIAGTVDVAHPRDPAFDLAVEAEQLEASTRSDFAAVVTGRAHLGGRYTRPVVTGDLRILRGEMDLDEVWRRHQIVQLDPSIFQLIDSATVSYRPPGDIPFLENLRLTRTTITAERGFWLRSRELNVEVSGSLDTEVDRQSNDLRLTGTLQAVEGDYALQLVEGVPARVFDIRGGTIDFVGTPGIDPTLDIDARYRVRRAQGDPLNVVASVTGRLQDPRVALTGDADLPLSESDLASYIVFGRSGAELTQAQSDVVSHGIGLVRPVATGLLSSELERALVETGLPVNHVTFTTPEYGIAQLDRYWERHGLAGVFHNTQLEVGIDAGPDLSLVGSVRIPTDDSATPDGSSAWRVFGARVEWRFRPDWTTELYVEDRFARTPSFGLSEIDDQKVWGLSLFREWGY